MITLWEIGPISGEREERSSFPVSLSPLFHSRPHLSLCSCPLSSSFSISSCAERSLAQAEPDNRKTEGKIFCSLFLFPSCFILSPSCIPLCLILPPLFCFCPWFFNPFPLPSSFSSASNHPLYPSVITLPLSHPPPLLDFFVVTAQQNALWSACTTTGCLSCFTFSQLLAFSKD